jgi:hypothetical protein
MKGPVEDKPKPKKEQNIKEQKVQAPQQFEKYFKQHVQFQLPKDLEKPKHEYTVQITRAMFT